MAEFFKKFEAELTAIIDTIVNFVKKLLAKELEGEDFADLLK